MRVRLVHKALRDDGGQRLDEGRVHRVYRGPRRKRGQRHHRSTGRHCGSVLRSPLEHTLKVAVNTIVPRSPFFAFCTPKYRLL